VDIFDTATNEVIISGKTRDGVQYIEFQSVKMKRIEKRTTQVHAFATAERKEQDIQLKMRTLHSDCGLPVNKWLDVLKSTEYLMNRTPTRTNEQLRAPYKIVNGTKPDMSNIQISGTAAMVHIPVQRRQAATTKGTGMDKMKLDERAKEKTTMLIHADNPSATMCLKGRKNRKMRHILIKTKAVQDAIYAGEIRLQKSANEDQLADRLMKVKHLIHPSTEIRHFDS